MKNYISIKLTQPDITPKCLQEILDLLALNSGLSKEEIFKFALEILQENEVEIKE